MLVVRWERSFKDQSKNVPVHMCPQLLEVLGWIVLNILGKIHMVECHQPEQKSVEALENSDFVYALISRQL